MLRGLQTSTTPDIAIMHFNHIHFAAPACCCIAHFTAYALWGTPLIVHCLGTAGTYLQNERIAAPPPNAHSSATTARCAAHFRIARAHRCAHLVFLFAS